MTTTREKIVHRRPVVCWETGESFGSIMEAADAVGTCRRAIQLSLRRGYTASSLHFYDVGIREIDRPVMRVVPWVRCRESGRIFMTVKSACDFIRQQYKKGVRKPKHKTIQQYIRKARMLGTQVYGFHFDDVPLSERRHITPKIKEAA